MIINPIMKCIASFMLLVSCGNTAAENKILKKKGVVLIKLNNHLNSLIGASSWLTAEHYNKKVILFKKKRYYASIKEIKENKIDLNSLPNEEKTLYKETMKYVAFIEKEFNEYVKNLDVNFTEQQYLAYTNKFWSNKNNAIVKMNKVDADYRRIINKTKYVEKAELQ